MESDDPQFIAYLFQSLRAELEATASVTTVPILNKANFEDVLLWTPDLPEQRAIAAVLRTVQRAKEACEKVIAATRALKQSLLHHLFTYGPVPFDEAERVVLRETPIGIMPESWRVARVGDLGDVVTGSTPSTKKPEYYGGPHMFITPGDIQGGKYVTVTAKWLSTAGLSSCRVLRRKAIVVVCIGATIGKTALTSTDRCATNQQCNSILTKGGIDPEFVFYALIYRAKALPSLAGRAAVPIVNKSNFCDFQIGLAPRDDQGASRLTSPPSTPSLPPRRSAAWRSTTFFNPSCTT